MNFKIVTFAIGLSFFSSGILAANTMTYQNTRGSILNLHINSDNTLSGTFTSAVASKECQQAIGLTRPIVGFIAKNALTISISYPECGVVNLIGNIENNKNLIDSLFIVGHESHNIAKEGPGSQLIGHDIFRRMK